jgi:hypothetical protein
VVRCHPLELARCNFPERVDVRAVRSTLPSPLPRASAKTPVLDAPSTLHVLDASGPDAVWQT